MDTGRKSWRSFELEAHGVAAMLDIGRISVKGSIKAHSSIYRRQQRSARTKPALRVWYWNVVERDPGWRWRTVLEDSDGLAIATQDTIHPPKHWASPNACIMQSLSSSSSDQVVLLQSSPESGLQVVIVAYQATIRLLPPFVECLKDMASLREPLQALYTAKPFNGAICQVSQYTATLSTPPLLP